MEKIEIIEKDYCYCSCHLREDEDGSDYGLPIEGHAEKECPCKIRRIKRQLGAIAPLFQTIMPGLTGEEDKMRARSEIIAENRSRILTTGELPQTWELDDLSSDLLPSDTCECCYKVYTDEELEQAKRTNIALCDSCSVDLMVDYLRIQGR